MQGDQTVDQVGIVIHISSEDRFVLALRPVESSLFIHQLIQDGIRDPLRQYLEAGLL